MSARWGFVLNKQTTIGEKQVTANLNMRFHDESRLVLKPFDYRQLARNRDSSFCDLKMLTKPLVRG